MEPPTKGTVTPLASMFSEEEARKAASYVEEKIGEKREEMNRLQQFVDENANLINLVKKLPDQLHHNVMVPFGKMAFFPGRLIHTNEFLVLLGENYYTERTSKQTVEVLRRRDKTLQSQIHSLKAEIEDFQTEASFFTTTASEAAEGLVEIREEYDAEEDSSVPMLQSGVKEPSDLPGGETEEYEVEDDEFARIMSRLNELEMEEEREGEDGDDRHEELDSPIDSLEESLVKGIRGETNHDKMECGKQETTKSILKKASGRSSFNREPSYSEPRGNSKFIEVLPEEDPQKQLDDSSKCIGKQPQYPKEHQSHGEVPRKTKVTWSDLQETSAKAANAVGPQNTELPIQKPEPKLDTNKAFTGSIIERDTNPHSQLQPPIAPPSKPVSRFVPRRR